MQNGDSENVPTSPKPVDVSKQETPRPTKSTPSPAPKPRPKPSIRKKAESPEIKVEDKSSKFQEKGIIIIRVDAYDNYCHQLYNR